MLLAGLTTVPSRWFRLKLSRATRCGSARETCATANIGPPTSPIIMNADNRKSVLRPARQAVHGNGGVDLGGGVMTVATGRGTEGEHYK